MIKMSSSLKLTMVVVLLAGVLSSCAVATVATVTAVKGKKRSNRVLYLSDSVPEVDKDREAVILTAFFGLDNELPPRSRAIDKKAPGKDGMPLVFSLELDPNTMQAADFLVTTSNGTEYVVEAASFMPANEEFELRTVLLIGDYGNYPDNPPVKVAIVGDLMSRTGVNFKNQQIEVISLEKGPVLSYAEYFKLTDDYPYVSKGKGCDCPKESSEQVVKAVWSGGVRALNGKELGNNEIDRFTVHILQNGDTIKVHPFQLADLDDNDNNIDLCIKEKGMPLYVEVEENTAIDPRDDKNPKTKIKVVSRW